MPNGLCDVVSAFRSDQHAGTALKMVSGRLFTLGAKLQADELFAARNVQRVQLPSYPFEKKRYWITEVAQYAESENDEAQASATP